MKKFLLALLVLIILVVLALLMQITKQSRSLVVPATTTSPTTTVPAPLIKKETTITTKLNQGTTALDVKVVPVEVLEDSRCPVDAECIWAGTVRVRVFLTSGLGTAEEIFVLDQPITTEAEEVTLIQVAPEPESGHRIEFKDYTFVFKIKKRNLVQ